MGDVIAALDALLTALDRRTRGLTARQFEHTVSPAMGSAFVKGWLAVGREPLDIPGEWQDMADSFEEIN